MTSATREEEFELGRLRGRVTEVSTQLLRAEQDVALGWRHWLKAMIAERRRIPPGTVPGPAVTVITPVYDPDPGHLQACLDSIAAQTYANWHHVLVDDGSRRRKVRTVLDHAGSDPRIRVIRHDRNLGIVAASNTALAAAKGDFVALLDHDDVAAPHALERLSAALAADPDAAFAYSDNDVLRADGRFADPFYKPDFSPERLRNQNYVLHMVMARRRSMLAAGGFRAGLDGAQDHDLLLRLSEAGGAVHVPEVLYHWREAAASVAADPQAKPYAYEAGRRAVQDHCDRVGIAVDVERGQADGVYRLRPRHSVERSVSVVIPTAGAARDVWGSERSMVVAAVRSMLAGATPDLEFVVVADESTPSATLVDLGRLAGDRLRVVPFDAPFNFSAKCNAGAAAATGELLLFLNDDTELIEATSVAEMASLLDERDVGMVGAKLLYADGTIQHAGHVFPGLATHALLGYPGEHPGPYRMLLVARECSGVTAAAAMVRASTFAEVGGFDERLPRNFNDVDLGFRIRARGLRIVWTPHAAWYHFESATRDPATGDDERELTISRWKSELEHDPYFNPNLAPHRSDWLELPGRSGAPPWFRDASGRRQFG